MIVPLIYTKATLSVDFIKLVSSSKIMTRRQEGTQRYQLLIMSGYTKGKPHEGETLCGHKSTLKIHLNRYQNTSEILKHSLEALRVEGVKF